MTESFDFRWGLPPLDDEGYTHVYGFMLRNYAKIGITRNEFLLIIHLSGFKYNTPNGEAKPSLKTIAALMGYAKDDSVRELVASLEKKQMLTVERPAGKPSVYNFAGFTRACLSAEEAPHSNGVPHHSGVVESPTTVGTKNKKIYKNTEDHSPSADAPDRATASAADPFLSEVNIYSQTGGDAPAPKKARARDVVFDAVAQVVFSVDPLDKADVDKIGGSYIAKIAKALRGAWSELDDQQLAQKLHAFGDDWHSKRDAQGNALAMPQGVDSVKRNFKAYMDADKPKVIGMDRGGTGQRKAVSLFSL